MSNVLIVAAVRLFLRTWGLGRGPPGCCVPGACPGGRGQLGPRGHLSRQVMYHQQVCRDTLDGRLNTWRSYMLPFRPRSGQGPRMHEIQAAGSPCGRRGSGLALARAPRPGPLRTGFQAERSVGAGGLDAPSTLQGGRRPQGCR